MPHDPSGQHAQKLAVRMPGKGTEIAFGHGLFLQGWKCDFIILIPFAAYMSVFRPSAAILTIL